MTQKSIEAEMGERQFRHLDETYHCTTVARLDFYSAIFDQHSSSIVSMIAVSFILDILYFVFVKLGATNSSHIGQTRLNHFKHYCNPLNLIIIILYCLNALFFRANVDSRSFVFPDFSGVDWHFVC